MTEDRQLAALQGEIARLRRSVQELSILNDLAQAIGSSFDPQQIIETIVDRSARAVGAEQATITLVDRETRVSVGTLVRYIDGADVGEHYHLNQGMLGYMLLHKKPCLCNDPAADTRLQGLDLPGSVRNILGVPLLVKSELIGVLIAYNKGGETGFDPEDQRLLAIIAAQSAQVLETARLLEQEKEAARLREEVRLAEQIQRGLLPEQPPDLPGYEVAARTVAAQVVGGDYYDYVPLDASRSGFCLGDVSGKGLPASLLMANLQATLRGQALQDGPCRQCVRWCNRLLYHSTSPEKFATLFYGVLDVRTHALTYCNAGHERPLFVPQTGDLRELATGGLPVGMLDDFDYGDDVCILEPGDLVLVYSDGVTDMENPAGEPFGADRLLEILRRDRGRPADELLQAILGAVQAHAAGTDPFDDVTLLAIRRVS